MITTRPVLACTALLALTLGVGCTTPTTSFVISVKNSSDAPVTVWLTKSGGQPDLNWLPPEQLATSPLASTDQLGGTVIPPGRTGEITERGKFEGDSLAILRVYAGLLTFDELLATPANSSLRVDVPLREGRNDLEVKSSPKFAVERVGG